MSSTYTPFLITPERVRKLALIANTKDFDEYYRCFEPQVHLLPDGSEAMVIIGYRQDHLVDIYHSPNIHLVKEDYTIVEKGANKIIETYFHKSLFEVNQHGLQLDIAFEDIYGRNICLKILENNPKKPLLMNLLAPVGYGCENPKEMMLVFMNKFSFVRYKKSDISINIGSKEIQPEVFIKPMGWLQYKYSGNSFVCKVFPNFSGELPSIVENKVGNNKFSLSPDGRIECIHVPIFDKELTLSFLPSFPNITSLRQGESFIGEWKIRLNVSTGTVGGKYYISTNEHGINIKISPDKGWIPDKPYPFLMSILFKLVKIFKQWPTTYQWDASITQKDDNTLFMESSWRRIGKFAKLK